MIDEGLRVVRYAMSEADTLRSAPLLATIFILFGVGYTIDYNSASHPFCMSGLGITADHIASSPTSSSPTDLYSHRTALTHILPPYSAPQAPQERSSLDSKWMHRCSRVSLIRSSRGRTPDLGSGHDNEGACRISSLSSDHLCYEGFEWQAAGTQLRMETPSRPSMRWQEVGRKKQHCRAGMSRCVVRSVREY